MTTEASGTSASRQRSAEGSGGSGLPNVVIVGGARNGTSMTAGLLAKAGYRYGEEQIRADHRNPTGFFESRQVLDINEELLDSVIKRAPSRGLARKILLRTRPAARQGHLARLPLHMQFAASSEIEARIARICAEEPFCLKDPRFCHTLPVWRPFLKSAVSICIFRHPVDASASLRQMHSQRHVSRKRALQIWKNAYEHILHKHRHEGRWLFVSFEDILEGTGIERISEFLDIHVDSEFVTRDLVGSRDTVRSIPTDVEEIHTALKEMSRARVDPGSRRSRLSRPAIARGSSSQIHGSRTNNPA